MRNEKHKLSVGVFAVIFDEQKRILCVKRNYGPKNWTTPGGAIDKDESPSFSYAFSYPG